MAKTDLGKSWESVFKRSWKVSLPRSFIYRLKDDMNGFKETSGNPCDFLAFAKGKLFMIECKEHKGASIPFVAIPQYDRLLKYTDLDGVFPGVLLWLSEKDKILWIDAAEMQKMVNNGEKSIGLRMLNSDLYNIIDIPFSKKRVFLEPDMSFLVNSK